MKRRVALIISLLWVCLCGCFAEAEHLLGALLEQKATQGANIGIYIKNLTTGDIYADYRSEALLVPASTMKILTTATALELLGSDFRFETYLQTNGKIENGILHGNLYIYGKGDPTLGSQKVGNQNFLSVWVQELKRLGIRQIDGDIIADASFFDGDAINPQWIWEDIGNYYAAGMYALPYLDNTLNVQLRSAGIGSVAEVVKTIPYIEGLQFENHIRCTEITYDGAYVHGVPYSNLRYLTGSIPSNLGIFGVKGDIPNPPLLLAQHLCTRLQESGIKVNGKATFTAENSIKNRTVLYTHYSVPLSEIIRETNQNSNNLYAEQIFRYIGYRIDVPCTIQNSVMVEQNVWRNRGISLSNCFVMDGSGLAPQDGISASLLVQLLQYMLFCEEKDSFWQSLPVSGQSGTLKGFLAGSELQGRVHAKSGTTSRVKSYAGYIDMPSGDTVAFAIIVNNATCKMKQVQTMIEKMLLDVYRAKKQ